MFAVVCCLNDYGAFYAFRVNTTEIPKSVIAAVAIPFALLLFVVHLLGQQKDTVFWIAASCLIVLLALFVPVTMFWMSTATYNAVTTIFVLVYFFCVLTLLYRGCRQGIPDARLLIYPIGLLFASITILQTVSTIVRTGRVESSQALRYLSWVVDTAQWPFPFDFQDITEVLVRLAILAILILRFARSRADEQRIYAELESARIVQGVLVPETLPAIPGLTIRSVYKPAGRVGGDFFQIIPLQPDGGLICIGDVSGKGLPAAMTVSLLVGTLRALSDSIQSPATLLSALNRHMLDHSRSGFTTCLILRADPHGQLTVANADHLAPYLNGREIALNNGLPLGLSMDSEYAESTVVLPLEAQLTLLTDGVLEARDNTGELFGFDRTAAISTQSAESIAQTAQAFGQNDDITILTLSLVSAATAAGS